MAVHDENQDDNDQASVGSKDCNDILMIADENNDNHHHQAADTECILYTSSTKSLRLVRYLSIESNHSDSGWNTYTDEDELFVQQFPKVELHVHFDGSFDPDILFQYMQTNPERVLQCFPVEILPPWDPERVLTPRASVAACPTARAYHSLCTCRGYRSLKEMLNCFEMFLPVVRNNLPLLEQLAFDFCQRQAQQNVIYTEVRYSPLLFAEGFDLDEPDKTTDTTTHVNEQEQEIRRKLQADRTLEAARAVVAAITSGFRKGCQAFPGITVNQIFCAICWRPDWALPTLQLALENRHLATCPVVGIDIAAGEEHYSEDRFPQLYGPHYEMIQQAKAHGMPITLHAGETETAENVRKAVQEYGATRIGHGYRVVMDEGVMEECKHKDIHFEVCPTSSVETGGWVYEEEEGEDDDNDGNISENTSSHSEENNNNNNNNHAETTQTLPKKEKKKSKKNWQEHPCMTMAKAGLRFSLNSDDPAVFHTSLAWQYRIGIAKMKMSRQRIVQCNLDAAAAAFCPDVVKERIQTIISAYAKVRGIEMNESENPIHNNNNKNNNNNDTKNNAVFAGKKKEPHVSPPLPTAHSSAASSMYPASGSVPKRSVSDTASAAFGVARTSRMFADRVYIQRSGTVEYT